MGRLITVILTGALLSSCGVARLPGAPSDLSPVLDGIRARAGVPGLMAMALRDGRAAVYGVSGVRTAGTEERLQMEDPMLLGSCAKAMTATLVARLVETGKISWSSTIAELLPDLSASIHGGYREVTLLEWLQHRGGLADRRRSNEGALLQAAHEVEGVSAQRLFTVQGALVEPPLPVGSEGHDYSNVGYLVVAAIVEAAASRTFESLIAEELFRPLGMDSATLGSPAGPRAPVGHRWRQEQWSPLPPGPEGALPLFVAPAGLVSCTLDDWGRFAWDHVAGERGDTDFLSQLSYGVLHRAPEGSVYAGGWRVGVHSVGERQERSFTHAGSDGTWHAKILVLPESGLVILAATNGGLPHGPTATTEALEAVLQWTLDQHD